MKKLIMLLALTQSMFLQAQPKLFFSLEGLRFNPTYKTYPYCFNSTGIGFKGLYRFWKQPFYLGISYMRSGFDKKESKLNYASNGLLVDTKIEMKPVYHAGNVAFRAEGLGLKNSNGIVAYVEGSAGLACLMNRYTIGNHEPPANVQASQNSFFSQGDYAQPYDVKNKTYQTTATMKNFTWNAYAGIGVQVGMFSLTWSNTSAGTEIGGIFLHFSVGMTYANCFKYLVPLNQTDVNSNLIEKNNLMESSFKNSVTNDIAYMPVARLEKTNYTAMLLQAGLTINF